MDLNAKIQLSYYTKWNRTITKGVAIIHEIKPHVVFIAIIAL